MNQNFYVNDTKKPVKLGLILNKYVLKADWVAKLKVFDPSRDNEQDYRTFEYNTQHLSNYRRTS